MSSLRSRGIVGLGPGTGSSIEAWLVRVADRPFHEYEIEDLARAIRQGLALEDVVPLALVKVSVNAASGELFDGELLVALSELSIEYWRRHRDQFAQACQAAAPLLELSNDEVQVPADGLKQVELMFGRGEAALG